MAPLMLVLLPLAGACGVKLCGRKHKTLRGVIVDAVCFAALIISALTLVHVSEKGAYVFTVGGVCGMGLSFRVDGFRALYVTVAAFMWSMTSLFSHRYFAHYHNRTRYFCFNLITLSGVMGMFLSDDLYTAFIFFEIMSMASYPWVAHDETAPALRAAATYLGIAVAGGMVTLMGMFILYRQTGSLAFAALREAPKSASLYTAAALTLVGFIAKAGAFPLHIWLPKAHPVAPAPASALLSGMLTKAGLFGVLVVSFNIFEGNHTYGCVLLVIALVTMTLGAVLGVFSNNLKRTLACSSMSQIGYILTGVAASVLLGEEGALPLQGAVVHMVNHSVLKLTLFMAAGAVYMNIHRLNLNEIQGFGRKKPILHIVFLLGALGLMGVPGMNGYLSKTMIHEGLAEFAHEGGFIFRIAEWVFLFAAGLTTAYMLKTYICLFWQKNRDAEAQARFDGMKNCTGVPGAVALMLSAALIPFIGLLPSVITKFAGSAGLAFCGFHEYESIEFFSFTNLKGGAITLIIGTIVYLTAVRKWMWSKEEGYIERWPAKLDLEDAVYRPVFCAYLKNALISVCSVLDRAGDTAAEWFMTSVTFVSRVCETLTDSCAVLMKLFIFTDNRAASENDSPVRRAAGGFQRALYSLKPVARPDPREVSDLSYGSRLTNTVSFGLIICTCGIVAAIVYALVK